MSLLSDGRTTSLSVRSQLLRRREPMTEPTYYMVTVDTEEEWDWGAGWPIHELAVTNIRQLPRFQQLCSRYGIKPTYFTDLAVLENDESRATLCGIAADKGVEIGMHIHPWNT